MSEPINWHRVFELRCRSKRGERLEPEEQKMLVRAHRADPKRYAS